MFLLYFDFCCDLDIWVQGQALRATICHKFEGNLDEIYHKASQTGGTSCKSIILFHEFGILFKFAFFCCHKQGSTLFLRKNQHHSS